MAGFVADTPDELTLDYAIVGRHVASVLESARTAAETIRDDARDDARRTAERVRDEAAGIIADARREAAETRHDAHRMGAEAEEAATKMRQDAQRFCVELKERARADAEQLIARAEEVARDHTRAAHERIRNLDASVALSEKRLTQLLAGLRDIADSIDNLVIGERASPVAAARRDGEAFEETLEAAASEFGARETATERG